MNELLNGYTKSEIDTYYQIWQKRVDNYQWISKVRFDRDPDKWREVDNRAAYIKKRMELEEFNK